MTPQAKIVMALWIPLVLIFLASYKPRTAIIVSYIGGMLFLPKHSGFNVPAFATFTNDKSTSYILILGLIFFSVRGAIGTNYLNKYKIKKIDIPMIVACLSPAISSLSNDLGLYDAIKQSAELTFLWGVPYFLGRIYINQLSGLKELSISIIKGGLIYIPLCLYEARMGPFLHSTIYGYGAHSSGIFQARRLGGWRPMVFMEHGLVVAIWMVSAVILAIWLWRSKTFTKIWDIPAIWIVSSLVVTFILLRSSGAYGYFVLALIFMVSAQYLKINLPVWLLVLGLIFYLSGRVTGIITEQTVKPITSSIFMEERNESLLFRLRNEDELTAKALERPFFGWGGWGRGRVFEQNSQGYLQDTTIIDSNWIYMLSNYGLVGLVSLYTALFLPIIVFLWRNPAKVWFDAKIAPCAALSIVLLLFSFDTLFNSGILAVFPLICGSLYSVVVENQNNRVPKRLSPKKALTNSY